MEAKNHQRGNLDIAIQKICDLTVYNFIAMSKKKGNRLALSDQIQEKTYTNYLTHQMNSNSATIFTSSTSHKTHKPSEHKKLRLKTEELSLEKPSISPKATYQALWTPRKAKWISSDEGLRQTEDSLQQILKKKRISVLDFTFLKQLGRGKHGIVYLTLHKQTGFIGALKVFQKEHFHSESNVQKSELQKMLIRQLKIQSYLTHNHILKVYSIFSDEKRVYLFMELGSDGQLLNLIQRKKSLNQEAISFILRSLLEAVRYLHANNILHRDLKPENIVLIHGFPKICDFGQSTVCNLKEGELRQTLCGTPLYLSPQILKGELYNEKADIWALGAMGYELFTGTNPFNIQTKQQLRRVITQNFQMSLGSLEFRNFLNYCLRKKAAERPSADKLLKHPFIRKWVQLQTSQQLCA